jgi:hypothetical protein
VYAFREGHTAESLAQSFPVLTLEQVYGAITYYLAHREVIDAYLQDISQCIEDLQHLQQMLTALLAVCHQQAQDAACPVIAQLMATAP